MCRRVFFIRLVILVICCTRVSRLLYLNLFVFRLLVMSYGLIIRYIHLNKVSLNWQLLFFYNLTFIALYRNVCYKYFTYKTADSVR